MLFINVFFKVINVRLELVNRLKVVFNPAVVVFDRIAKSHRDKEKNANSLFESSHFN